MHLLISLTEKNSTSTDILVKWLSTEDLCRCQLQDLYKMNKTQDPRLPSVALSDEDLGEQRAGNACLELEVWVDLGQLQQERALILEARLGIK